MKRWIISLGLMSFIFPVQATWHRSFLATENDLYEESFYGYGLETPRMYSPAFPENLDPTRVEVPLVPGGFGIGLRAFFLRAIDNQLDYVVSDPAPNTFTPSISSSITAIEPKNEVFFGGFLQYAFPFTGRDINLNIQFHQTNEHDTTNVDPLTDATLWTLLSLNGFLAARADGATSDYDLDTLLANLELGERIFAGTHFEIHPFMGAGFADIERNISTTYFGVDAANPLGIPPFFVPVPDTRVTQESRFAGGGPRFGINGTYHFTHGFAMTGLIANTFYVGSIRSKSVTFDGIGSQGIHRPSINRVVPAIEGKIGLAFTHPFRTSLFKLEGGYQVQHFFNALDSFRSVGNEGGYLVKLDHDLSLDGPYLEASVIGLTCPTHFSLLPVYLTVPRLPGGFELGVGVMGIRPDDNSVDFALTDPTPVFDPVFPIRPSANATLRAADTDYDWGYRLHAGYTFHNTPYDLAGNFQFIQNKETDSITMPSGQTLWTILNFPISEIYTLRNAQSAHATFKYEYEQADIEFGFQFWAGELAQFRLFGGADFAQIFKDMHVTYNNVSTVPVEGTSLIFPHEDIVQKSHFDGAGPMVGFDMHLPLWFLDLHSRIAGSMLIGRINLDYRDEINAIPELEIDPLNMGLNLHHDNRLVPAFETRLGFTSNWSLFRNSWILEVGYQLNHYFNAVTEFKRLNSGPIAGFTDIGNSSTLIVQDRDISFEGPYLDLTITGLGACPPECIRLDPIFLMAPQLYGGIVFGLEAVSLRPDANNLDYALISPLPADPLLFAPSTNSVYKILEPSHDWGFRVNLGYHFPLTPTGVAINYFEYKSDDSESISAPIGEVIWIIFSPGEGDIDNPLPFPIVAQGAIASLSFDIREFNFEFARHVKMGDLMLRTYAGIGIDRLHQNFSIHYTGTSILTPGEDPIPAGDTFITQTNEFKGVGPRFGVDANFPFFYGLGVTGHAATNLLVGKFDSSFVQEVSGFVNPDPALTVLPISIALNPDSRSRIVPALTLKFGLSYTVMLPNCGQCSELIFEGGYESNHYFNVVDSLRPSTNTGEGNVKLEKDINLDGPYLKLTLIL